MIALVLSGIPYEQDIRELFMAFFPGEIYTHEALPGADILFTGTVQKSTDADTSLFLEDSRYENGEQYFFRAVFSQSGVIREFTAPVYKERFDTKSELKRRLYRVLQEVTGRSLAWGTLTGIRPTRLAAAGYDFEKEFYVSPEKTRLCMDTADRQKEILKDFHPEEGWSLYIGIPFCPTRCLYCSFTSYPIANWQDRKEAYIRALKQEITETARIMQGRPLRTVYMGGGTPTSLEAEDLIDILEHTKRCTGAGHPEELTVEAGRPDSITRDKLSALKACGVSRISVNPQTMNQKTLDLIGRRHTVEEVREKFALAREAGFDNINMDIIAGLPGENVDDMVRTMEELKALGPDSITVHSLAIKRAARLNEEGYSHPEGEGELIAKMLKTAAEYVHDMGMYPYYLYRQKNIAGNFENVGYSLPGKEGLYNVLIMEELGTIIGCGAGSSTKTRAKDPGVRRFENVKDPQVYIDRIDTVIEKKKEVVPWL